MLACFDFVRDVNLLSVTLRMVLAVVCGGLIGLEREYKRRPAGFRAWGCTPMFPDLERR